MKWLIQKSRQHLLELICRPPPPAPPREALLAHSPAVDVEHLERRRARARQRQRHRQRSGRAVPRHPRQRKRRRRSQRYRDSGFTHVELAGRRRDSESVFVGGTRRDVGVLVGHTLLTVGVERSDLPPRTLGLAALDGRVLDILGLPDESHAIRGRFGSHHRDQDRGRERAVDRRALPADDAVVDRIKISGIVELVGRLEELDLDQANTQRGSAAGARTRPSGLRTQEVDLERVVLHARQDLATILKRYGVLDAEPRTVGTAETDVVRETAGGLADVEVRASERARSEVEVGGESGGAPALSRPMLPPVGQLRSLGFDPDVDGRAQELRQQRRRHERSRRQ